MSDSSMYTGISEVFDVVRLELEKLKMHEHISIETLADRIKSDCAGTPASYLPNMIRLFVKSTKGKYTIELGREGGVYLGGRPPKEARARCETCNQVLRQNKDEAPISSVQPVNPTDKEIA